MNSETQRLFKKLGFPMMTKDETEDLDQSLMSLQDPSSFDGSTMADAPVSGPGGTDLTNVYYVNFNPDTQTQSPHLRDQLKSVQADVTLNAQFLSIKSNDALNSKVSSREIDSNNETAKANYKAKVTNYLAQNAPWYVLEGQMMTPPSTCTNIRLKGLLGLQQRLSTRTSQLRRRSSTTRS